MAVQGLGLDSGGEAPREPNFRSWTASAGGPSVEFDTALIEEIRSQCVMALHGMGKGGVEVGGILIGSSEGDRHTIDMWRPVRCSYSRGSSFLLSDRDLATLSCQIEAMQVDPALEGKRVLGWFVSHIRGGIEPRADESQLHMRLFPAQGSLLIVVQPQKFGDAQAGIHVFEPGDPPSLRPLLPLLPILPAPGSRAPGADARTTPQPQAFPSEPETRASHRRWPAWVAVSAGIAFIVILIFVVRGQRPAAPQVAVAGPVHIDPTGPPRALLSLHLRRSDDAIEISWDASNPAVAAAESATIVVLDGGDTFSRPLKAEEMKLGRIDYTRSLGELRVRLIVRTSKGEMVEEAHYQPHSLPLLSGRPPG